MADRSRRVRTQRVEPLARHGQLKHHGAVRSVLGLIGIALVIAVVSGTSVAAIAVWRVSNTVASHTVNIHAGGTSGPPSVGAITGPVNIVLAGSDSGDGNAAYGPRGETLNDVTILIHISPASHSVTALSIPRDLYVTEPSCVNAKGKTVPPQANIKFNTALSRGGLPCVVSAVTGLTGLQVQYAALIQFDGVVAMSNAVGGVQVCLAHPIKDPRANLTLPAGEVTLQGADALGFLRTRHGLPDGSDLDRISNQQVFLSALMRKIKSSEVLTNPVTLYELATAAAQNMQLSTELAQPTTMVAIASALKSIPLDRISFVQYPSTPVTINNISYTQADVQSAKILTNAIAADKAVVAPTVGGAAIAASQTPTSTPTSSGSATASSSPSATATSSDAPVVLPSQVSGQTAADQTCSKGSGKG